jgi:hypothetical protein
MSSNISLFNCLLNVSIFIFEQNGANTPVQLSVLWYDKNILFIIIAVIGELEFVATLIAF